jgi:hypothetical protein
MADLTAKKRKALADQTFAIPAERKYPIPDRRHAANALARVAQVGTPAEQAQVKAAVKKKYPDMPSVQD